MASDDYERIICVKNEVFIYKIPPRQSSRGYRAADWKLDQPDWTTRMRIVDLNNKLSIKFDDKVSGQLFAEAPVEQYPGPVVEAVSDSSRYFVVKILDSSGRHAFIGIGFADRGDSFDFNVSLQDYFRRENIENAPAPATSDPAQPLDLSFKEGQTIKINIGSASGQDAKARLKKPAVGSGILPPPPSGGIAPPPSGGIAPRTIAPQSRPIPQPVQPVQPVQQADGVWGDFASSSPAKDWVQF